MSLGFGATAEIFIYTFWYLVASILDEPMTRAAGPVRHVALYTKNILKNERFQIGPKTIYAFLKNLSVIIS